MNSKNIIKIGDVYGDHNTIIQIISRDGKEIKKTVGNLVEPLLKNYKKEIRQLQQQIEIQEETIKDKKEIIGYQKSEIIQFNSKIIKLKSQLAEKNKLLEEKEKSFTEIFIKNNGRDLSNANDMYSRALEALLKGNLDQALRILDGEIMRKEKQKLDTEREQQVKNWLLKAALLKIKNEWGDELNACYENTADLVSNWKNNVRAADHFSFINDLNKAYKYYNISLEKAQNDDEKAQTLNDLANLQKKKNELKPAEQNYKESLKIFQQLEKTNPNTYQPDIATTLNNLANLQKNKNELKPAEKNYIESLKIRQKLVKTNPKTYQPDMAQTLNNLANLQQKKNELDIAEQNYKESIEIYQELADTNPETYQPHLAQTLNNLATLQSKKNELDIAEQNYNRVLQIYQELSKTNPKTYLPHLGIIKINMAIFYQEDIINKTLSIQLINEALAHLSLFDKLPYIQKYITLAHVILKKWKEKE